MSWTGLLLMVFDIIFALVAHVIIRDKEWYDSHPGEEERFGQVDQDLEREENERRRRKK